MTNTERFLRIMDYRTVDRLPLYLVGPWPDTVARWRREGLPEEARLNEFLGVKPFGIIGDNSTGPFPPFEERVIREEGDFTISTDGYGRTVKKFNDHTSMPHWLEFPVKNGRDLKRVLDERFNPDTLEERFNRAWEDKVRKTEQHDHIFLVAGGNYYWTLRSLAGVDGASYLFYDAPELVDELFERINHLCLESIRRTSRLIKLHTVGFGEDLAFKTGPLISPAMFKKFILPRYRKVMDLAHSKEISLAWYDSDGDLRQLIPDYLEVGINIPVPCEVAAGMSCPELRKKFGKELRMVGGIDKRALTRGRKAIDNEIERNRPLMEEGGYIPAIDHSVSSDISFDNYRYYVERISRVSSGR